MMSLQSRERAKHMIPFRIEELYVEHVYLKSCTTALGGSISVVDDARSTDDKEVYRRIKVPMAVVRKFVKVNQKVARYMKPALTAVTFYGKQAVALERHPYNRDGDGQVENLAGQLVDWISKSETNLDKLMMPLTLRGDWYIDGTFVYSFTQSDINNAVDLSDDGRFKSVNARAFKLADIHDADKMCSPEDRTCLSYTTKCGTSSMSPPIWKQLGDVGGSAIGLSEDEETGNLSADAIGIMAGRGQFDKIDDLLSVNLAFALNAGKKVAGVFGYDSIEPLGLDDLMIQLRTVNLPRIAKEVKQTYDIGMPFTHAVAWLLGLTARTETLDTYIVLRSLLKYLTTKGIYRSSSFNPDSVYLPDQDIDSVQLLTMEEAHLTMLDRLKKLGAIPLGWASKITA